MMDRIIDIARNHWRSGILSGGAILFISMTVVNGGNYVFNLILGRWLGPAAFADLSLIVTLMLMITFVTITFQLTAAKFFAAHAADGAFGRMAALRRWMGRRAWIGGGLAMIILVAGAPLWQQFFHTESPWPFVLLGLGLPVYFAQGVDRGVLQGQMHFGRLAVSYQAEMWVRLVVGILLVALGFAVSGAVLAITLSFGATWLVARRVGPWANQAGHLEKVQQKAVVAFAGPVVLMQLSQILINNSDIMIVKRFFPSEEAGLYAALALIGRIVFFATWSVVTVLFPMVAQRHQRGESHRHLLALGLGLVGLVSVAIIVAARLFPELIINTLFGEAYLSVAPLLWLYAVATALYALANVVVNYRLSASAGRGVWFAVGAGVAQVVLLSIFHASLRQVVVAQIILMGVLLAVLLAWDLWLVNRQRATSLAAANS